MVRSLLREHQKEIVKGNKLKNIAQVSEKGVAYAKAQSRDRYIKISKENKKAGRCVIGQRKIA